MQERGPSFAGPSFAPIRLEVKPQHLDDRFQEACRMGGIQRRFKLSYL